MAVKKTKKLYGFVIYSFLKDSAFTTVKRDAAFYTRRLKGYHLSIKGVRKGCLFCPK